MKTTIFLIVLVLSNLLLYAQEEEDKYYLAEESIYEENFEYALKLYLEILLKSPNDAEINFKTGFCYLNIHNKKDKSIPYFLKAIDKYSKKSNKLITPIELYFYLGRAYHVTGNYDNAIISLTKAKEFAVSLKSPTAVPIIEQEIVMCNNAIKLTDMPENVAIELLNTSVNSSFNEIAPVLYDNDKKLLFASDFDENVEDEEFVYEKSIYESQKNSINWSIFDLVSDFISISGNKYVCDISSDEKNIIINIDDDLYISNLDESSKFTNPQKITGEINSKTGEFSACFAFNDNAIIFSSDRKKGFGGKDLYISIKDNKGLFGKPVNLGSQINSKYDEDCPYFSDDRVLFFSSNGDKSMGGFDVLQCELNNDSTWSEVLNLGYPINTVEDELDFSLNSFGNIGYYSSNKTGTFGKFDILKIDFKREFEKNFIICGDFITKNKSKKVNIYDSNTGELIENYVFDNEKTYSVMLEKLYSYIITYTSNGCFPNLSIIEKEETKIDSVINNINLSNLSDDIVYNLEITNNILNIESNIILNEIKNISDKDLLLEIKSNSKNNELIQLINNELISSGFIAKNIKTNANSEFENDKMILNFSTKNVASTTIETTVNETYTIQLGAFINTVNVNTFSKVGTVKVYKGKDKFSRVTYGDYKTEAEAQSDLERIVKLGYKQAFTRPLSLYKSL